jgi:uncharacterized protein (TIGR02996 family)
MMRSDEAFLQGLLENPQDDALRLVYADWLEDRADIRGEFLRVAVALRTAAAEDPRLPALRRSVQELRPRVPAGWLVGAFRAFAEDDVREVVFRHLLGEGSTGDSFLQVENDGDPSWYLLDRLAADYHNDLIQVGVKPISAADSDYTRGGVFDRETGLRGGLYRIDSLRWVTEDRCDVTGSETFAPLAGSGYGYQVELQDGHWIIRDWNNTWIS